MKNNKGAALMQVLLITLVLAGIATMLLRVTLSRTNSARQTRVNSSAEVLIQACMAEVNTLWANKTEEAFLRDMNGYTDVAAHSREPIMYCRQVNNLGECPNTPAGNRVYDYTCTYDMPGWGGSYVVTAKFEKVTEPDYRDTNLTQKDVWKLVYRIQDKNTL